MCVLDERFVGLITVYLSTSLLFTRRIRYLLLQPSIRCFEDWRRYETLVDLVHFHWLKCHQRLGRRADGDCRAFSGHYAEI
jgi:hypothetical protein